MARPVPKGIMVGMGIVESSQMYICLSCLQMAAQLYSTTNCKYNTYVSLLGVDTSQNMFFQIHLTKNFKHLK